MPSISPKFWFLSSQWFASTSSAAVTAPIETLSVARIRQGAPVVGMISSGAVFLWAPVTNTFRALPMVTT